MYFNECDCGFRLFLRWQKSRLLLSLFSEEEDDGDGSDDDNDDEWYFTATFEQMVG